MRKQGRKPKEITKDERGLVIETYKEYLVGATMIELVLKEKEIHINYNRIHKIMLEEGLAKHEENKQKRRKYKCYERKHSLSLVHMDRFKFKGKWYILFEDDASRLILCGGEYDSEEEIHNLNLIKKADRIVYGKYSAVIREVNTDKGTQFYCSKNDKNGNRGRTEFELYLESMGKNHIPSRRNHPQTNGKKER